MKKQLIGAVLMSMTAAMLSGCADAHSDVNSETHLRAGIVSEMCVTSEADLSKIKVSNVGVAEPQWLDGFLTARCNIRKEPSTDAEILAVYEFNSMIVFWDYGDPEWVKMKYWDGANIINAYVSKDYISLEECAFRTVEIPNYSGFKSWMSYKAITNKSSNQYKIQQLSYTGDYGIRMYDDYYLIAIGTGAGVDVGTYVDLVLENGVMIHCIVGDIKASQDTDSTNLITTHSNCCSEFIVDPNALNESARTSGDVSSVCAEWSEPVTEILIYEGTILKCAQDTN